MPQSDLVRCGTCHWVGPRARFSAHYELAHTMTDKLNLQPEADPNGIKAGEPGAKLDAGKCDVGLLWESFPRALFAVAEVATFGANKYSRGGWKEVQGGLLRYAGAEGRHKLYRYKGEVKDKESGFYHRSHEVWNALAQLEIFLKEEGI